MLRSTGNVVGKRAGHVSERATSPDFTCLDTRTIETTTILPKMRPKARNSIEQEGRVQLAMLAIEKEEIRNICEAVHLYNVPCTTL